MNFLNHLPFLFKNLINIKVTSKYTHLFTHIFDTTVSIEHAQIYFVNKFIYKYIYKTRQPNIINMYKKIAIIQIIEQILNTKYETVLLLSICLIS